MKEDTARAWYVARQKALGFLYPPRCSGCDELLNQDEAAYCHPAYRYGARAACAAGGAAYAVGAAGVVREAGAVGICRSCRARFPVIGTQICLHCGRPVTEERFEYCYDCAKKDRTRGFTQGRSLFLYQGAATFRIPANLLTEDILYPENQVFSAIRCWVHFLHR